MTVSRTLLCIVISCLLSGCMSLDLGSFLNPPLEETVVLKGKSMTRNKVLLLDVSGVISAQPLGTFGAGNRVSPDDVRAILDKAKKDNAIKAVVVRVDTPGGEVTASDTIYQELASFKKRTGLPVYVSMLSMATSGGYYISMAGDEIYAHPTTVTGSIGVVARFPNFKGLADKIGYDEEVIVSGPMKAMGHPLKTLEPQQREVFQNMINAMYDRFLEVVIAGRAEFATRAAIQPIADGRIYTAQQAVDKKLVDGIAYLPEVIEKAKAAAGIRHAKVVTYLSGGGKDSTIYTSGQGIGPLMKVDLASFASATKPGFYYIWLRGSR